LPLLSEVKKSVQLISQISKVNSDLVMLEAQEEISPWDLFDPFPPSNYVDYGYLEIKKKFGKFISSDIGVSNTKTTHVYWELLSDKEKVTPPPYSASKV
jgi:hypothetical protein